MSRTARILVLVVGLATPWCIAGPAAADNVTIGVNTPTTSFGLSIGSPPPVAPVQGLPVYHAPSVPHNYFMYDRYYYLFHEGTWFYSAQYNGPWFSLAIHQVPRPILAVPVTYYKKVPPGQWKKRHGPPDWSDYGKGKGKGKKHGKKGRDD